MNRGGSHLLFGYASRLECLDRSQIRRDDIIKCGLISAALGRLRKPLRDDLVNLR